MNANDWIGPETYLRMRNDGRIYLSTSEERTMKLRGRRGVSTVKVDDDGIDQPFVRRSALPRLTLYAHGDVVRTLKVIAADDGVQVQVVLRQAVSDYLRRRGHRFADLVIGK